MNDIEVFNNNDNLVFCNICATKGFPHEAIRFVQVGITEEIVPFDFTITLGGLAGVYDEKKPNEYQSEDYGTIYRNQIGTILEHTFGGTPRHKKNGNTYTFDPVELARVGKTYNLTTSIQTKMIVIEDEGEDGEHGEGIREEHPSKNEENSDDSRGKNSQKEADNRGSPSIEPSPPSLPSPTAINSIYRAYGDTWKCHNCRLNDDKWFMQVHDCKGAKK